MPRSRIDIGRRSQDNDGFRLPTTPGYQDIEVYCHEKDKNAVELIVIVYKLLKAEYVYLKNTIGRICDLSSLADVVQRTANACDVDCSTIKSLIRDHLKNRVWKRYQGGMHCFHVKDTTSVINPQVHHMMKRSGENILVWSWATNSRQSWYGLSTQMRVAPETCGCAETVHPSLGSTYARGSTHARDSTRSKK